MNLINVNKALNDTIYRILSTTEFNTVKIVPEDLSEPITRPAFKVCLEDSNSNKSYLYDNVHSIKFGVYFFAQDVNKTKMDNLKVRNYLINGLIENIVDNTNTYFYQINEDGLNFLVEDGVLICNLTIENAEQLELGHYDANAENIENITKDFNFN